jgi:hypothetical protein
MQKDIVQTMYKLGGIAKPENTAVFALALLSQNGTGFIRLTDEMFTEYERLTGWTFGAADYELNNLINKEWVSHQGDYFIINWETVFKEQTEERYDNEH